MREMTIRAQVYILSTMFVGALFLILNMQDIQPVNPWALLLLSALASLSLILKVVGSTRSSNYNLSFLIYGFTYFLLGPQATFVVIVVSNLVDWFVRRYEWYIQTFNVASYIIVTQVSGLVFAAINPSLALNTPVSALAALASMAAFTFLNHVSIGLVIWFARGETFAKSGILGLFPMMLDFTMLCMGATTAILWTYSPFAALLSLVPLYLMYSSLRLPALERQSETDPKTGLFNARFFSESLSSELGRAQRFDRPLTVVMADLDLLRDINNNFGHLAGDAVLAGVAELLKNMARDYDIVARFGGEEFAIMMPETTVDEAMPLVESMRAAIEETRYPVSSHEEPIQATMSFGIAGRLETTRTTDQLIHNADVALYEGKERGRNTVYYFSGDNGGTVLPVTPAVRPEIEVAPEEPESVVTGPTDLTANEDLVTTLVRIVGLRAPELMEHSMYVANYAVLLGQEMGLGRRDIELLRHGGLMHDIGKLAIPENIVLKPIRLTEEEYAVMRRHVAVGADLLRGLPVLHPLLPLIRHHHEWFNGRGYPDGLAGSNIPLTTRILSVADTVDAMASDRPYRSGLSRERIIEELRRQSGKQFDPNVVEAFLCLIEREGPEVIVTADVKRRSSLDWSTNIFPLSPLPFLPKKPRLTA